MALSNSFKILTRSWAQNVQKRTNYFIAGKNILELRDRGLIKDFYPSDTDDQVRDFVKHLTSKPRTIYAGFDPTADSLHVGNLLVLKFLLHCHRAGHNTVALIGGATARIGDPSGRSTERVALEDEIVGQNVMGLHKTIETILENHEEYFTKPENRFGQPMEIVDNNSWYAEENVLDFFSKIGSHFRLAKMLSRKNVKERMKENQYEMSFLEFSYQIFQAYDWYYLYFSRDCTVQIGGSDQMGNIAAGHDFISRRLNKVQTYGITLPLITDENGEKIGKSCGNPVWLSPDKTSDFDFYQYWFRQPDSQVEEQLNCFTFLTLNEIRDVISVHDRDRGKKHAQQKLAEQVTLLVRGRSGLNSAKEQTKFLYSKGRDIESISMKTAEELRTMLGDQAAYLRMLYSPEMSVGELAYKLGCFRNEQEAIYVVEKGGFSVNDVKRKNPDEIVMPNDHILKNDLSLIRIGKKRYFIVEWDF